MSTPKKRCCQTCKQLLNVSEFNVRSGPAAEREGRAGQPYGKCKNCKRKAKVTETDGNLAYALRALLWRCGSRAKKVHKRDGLTPEDLYEVYAKQSGRCALTGFELTYVRGKGRVQTNVSLDRVDNELGYTKENIQLTCIKANEMKGDADDEALLTFCRAIIKVLGRRKK
jgi:hypothetical protein